MNTEEKYEKKFTEWLNSLDSIDKVRFNVGVARRGFWLGLEVAEQMRASEVTLLIVDTRQTMSEEEVLKRLAEIRSNLKELQKYYSDAWIMREVLASMAL